MTQTSDLWQYDLTAGASDHPRTGACTMDAVSWFAYGRLGDHPQCACPILTEYVIGGQDAMPNNTRQLLKPFILRLIGSRDRTAEAARLQYLTIYAAKVFFPMALDAVQLRDVARPLRQLPNAASQTAIRDVILTAVDHLAALCSPSSVTAGKSAVHLLHAVSCVTSPWPAAAVAHCARCVAMANPSVWNAYIDALDGALNLGKQGDFDLGLAPTRLREFEEARLSHLARNRIEKVDLDP